MIDRCDNCDREGCREARAATWAPFYACSCKPNLSNPCEHQRAFQDAHSDCQAHAVNWRERALAAESDLTALCERMRWRDVADDCPDPFENVLLWNGYAFEGWLSDNDGRFYDPNGEQIYNVTHWRPIDAPEPMPAAPEVQALPSSHSKEVPNG